MMSWFDWVSFLGIFGVAVAGGWIPLTRREAAQDRKGFPLGQAFAAGVFLALSLFMMLPAGNHLLGNAFPHVPFPLGASGCAAAFVLLLSIQHWIEHQPGRRDPGRESPVIPLIMTVMIAIPSFLLGTALSLSTPESALMILLAIVAHKGTAGFALALNMVRSALSPAQCWIVYLFFALSTPMGILLGAQLHEAVSGPAIALIKGVVLSLASGVFLFMAALHDLEKTSMIRHCRHLKGFLAMLSGLLLTLGVRAVIGLAHTGHTGG
jgi:zinc transporter 1/2/3